MVSDWLKFAEAKNAALLVAASALVLALVEYLPDEKCPTFIWWCFVVGNVCLVLSAVICLLSFIPQVKFPWIASRRKTSPDDNLFFFGHIADYSAKEFVAALYHAEGVQPTVNKLQVDLAGQVITNARIGLRKFRLFAVSAWVAVIGITLLSVAVVGVLLQ